MPTRLSALLLAVGVVIADRASKYWVVHLYDLPARGDVPVLPFFSLTMVWNRGVSMGLFTAGSPAQMWGLVAMTAVISVIVAVMMWRAEQRFAALCLAAVLGGAIGNLVDRFVYAGAVADFIRLHAFGASFYVFNIADAAISIGVALLLLDSLRRPVGSAT